MVVTPSSSCMIHRLHGLDVRPPVEHPCRHRPHRALDLEECAVQRAPDAVGKDARVAVFAAGPEVDLADLERLVPAGEPDAHVLGLRQDVEEELGGASYSPRDQHLTVARERERGRATSSGRHCTGSFAGGR